MSWKVSEQNQQEVEEEAKLQLKKAAPPSAKCPFHPEHFYQASKTHLWYNENFTVTGWINPGRNVLLLNS